MKKLILVLVLGAALTPVAFAHGAINTINGLTNATQFLTATGTDANLSLRITSSSPSTNFFQSIWSGILSILRGGTGTSTIPSIGQLLIGNGTGYNVANLTQGSNVVITNATGSITVGVTSTPAFTSISLTNPLVPVYGGTGVSSYVKGDILVAQNSNTLVRLPHGQDGQVLVASSTAPLGIAWQTLNPTPPIQIAFDNSAQNQCVSCSSNSLSLTTTSTSNRILLAGIMAEGNSSDVISSVSYGGQTMTRVDWGNNSGGTNGPMSTYLYYLLNPPSGSNTFTATSSASITNFGVSLVTYTGVGSIDASSTQVYLNQASGDRGVTVTPTKDNAWVVGTAYVPNTESAGTNTTLRLTRGNGPAILESTSNPIASPTATTININGNGPSDTVIIGVALESAN